MEPAIEVRGLTKEYVGTTAVAGIDFAVRPGSVFAFLGPNGAGKTTTVEILEGLRRATSGSATVLGLDPWTEAGALHRRIGVMPQGFRFFEKITPAEAIRYYATLFRTTADARALLARVELADKADARFDTLSGGQKQKLGLALALTNQPEVCFLDEPTTGLDPQARRAIWDVIRALQREGRTIFLTTHYLEEAQLLADDVAIIHHGRVIASGTPEAIIRDHRRPARLRLEGPPALAEYLRARVPGPVTVDGAWVEVEFTDPHALLPVLDAAVASGLPVRSVATAQDTLEDVFVRLVGRMDEGALRPEAAA